MDTPKSLVCLSMSTSYLPKRQRRSLDLSRRELGTFAGAKGYGKRNQNHTQTFLLASFIHIIRPPIPLILFWQFFCILISYHKMRLCRNLLFLVPLTSIILQNIYIYFKLCTSIKEVKIL
ncbi:hypothetical protein Avbf_15219 [Armadillidium vulgare]|nr:hypothetical protein Avbf_15219 [Armadillidium vulgare]